MRVDRHPRDVDAARGELLEHRPAEQIVADHPADRDPQPQPGGGARGDRARPADRERRLVDEPLRLPERRHDVAAAQDQVGVHVAKDDQVERLGHDAYDSRVGPRIEVVRGDITAQSVDAIVNAANASLLGGGGVDGAIHRAGGPAILAACRELRATSYPDGLPTGAAAATTAGELDARWVIHTVGPVYGRDPDPPGLLASCHVAIVRVADEVGARTVAAPAISTGRLRLPDRRGRRGGRANGRVGDDRRRAIPVRPVRRAGAGRVRRGARLARRGLNEALVRSPT